jgi:hypothetical protein
MRSKKNRGKGTAVEQAQLRAAQAASRAKRAPLLPSSAPNIPSTPVPRSLLLTPKTRHIQELESAAKDAAVRAKQYQKKLYNSNKKISRMAKKHETLTVSNQNLEAEIVNLRTANDYMQYICSQYEQKMNASMEWAKNQIVFYKQEINCLLEVQRLQDTQIKECKKLVRALQARC